MSETPEMVERVARAIEPETFELPRINLNRDVYERAYRRARSAIEAMLNPNHAMEDAGWAHMDTGGPFSMFNAMIEKALATPAPERKR